PLPHCGRGGTQPWQDCRAGWVRASSAAGDGVDVADAFGQSGLVPAAASVLGPEHLAETGDAVDLVRVARMHCDAHHRRLGLDAVVEALPGLTDVIGPVDRPVGAARR